MERPGIAGGLRTGEACEEPAANTGELGGVAAADEGRQIPAGQFLPDVAVAVEREQVPRGLQFLGEVAANRHEGDAGAVASIIFQGGVGATDQDCNLADAAHVGQLLERDREPSPAGLHGRRGGGSYCREAGRERLHRGHHTLAAARGVGGGGFFPWLGAGDRGGPAETVGIVDCPGQGGSDQIHEVVEHEVAERRGQEIIPQDRLGQKRDLRTVPLAGETAGGYGDWHADEVERIAGGVGGIVSLVDPAELVEVVEVAGELIQVERGLEGEWLVAEAEAGGILWEGHGSGAGYHDRVSLVEVFVARWDQALDRG